MSLFARTFSVELINDQVFEESLWFKDMLLAWRPAGDALHRDGAEAHQPVSSSLKQEDPRRLRLAIRNGYLNFYRCGQPVANIGFDPTGCLQARIHNKYVLGKEGSGQRYLRLAAAGLHDRKTNELRPYGGPDELHRWLDNANQHLGEEKQFVDLVVARNSDTIDLEMALPAFGSGNRIAPRMDLVTLEPADDNWRIVFWEVKRAGDARARCRGDDVSPKVVDQLARYTEWLGHANHLGLVATAYRNTCRLLVAFHVLAKSINLGIEALGPGIIAAAAEDAPPLLVDDRPRLLIDDHDGNLAFTKNGHLDKLRNKGVHVQMVHSRDQMTLETGLCC